MKIDLSDVNQFDHEKLMGLYTIADFVKDSVAGPDGGKGNMAKRIDADDSEDEDTEDSHGDGEKKCKECGAMNPKGAKTCKKCGEKMMSNDTKDTKELSPATEEKIKELEAKLAQITGDDKKVDLSATINEAIQAALTKEREDNAKKLEATEAKLAATEAAHKAELEKQSLKLAAMEKAKAESDRMAELEKLVASLDGEVFENQITIIRKYCGSVESGEQMFPFTKEDKTVAKNSLLQILVEFAMAAPDAVRPKNFTNSVTGHQSPKVNADLEAVKFELEAAKIGQKIMLGRGIKESDLKKLQAEGQVVVARPE